MSTTPNDILKPTYIYVLKDPDTLLIRYIGKTVKSLSQRLQQHLCDAKNLNIQNHKVNWIRSLLKNGGKIPIIEEIDSCLWKDSLEKEIFYIDYYTNLGCKLVNSTKGGEGNLGYKKSDETIEKLKTSLRKHSKPVYQYDLSGNFIREYETLAEAVETLNLQSAKLSACLKGTRKKHKNFMWSYVKLDKIEPYSRKINEGISYIKGTKHSDLANLIKLEENIERCNNVYLYKSSDFSKQNFLYEGVSLLDAAEYLINNNLCTSKNKNTIKSSLSNACLTKNPYLGIYVSYEKPDFIDIPKSSHLLLIKMFDFQTNELLEEISGLSDFCIKTNLVKANVINNLKGVTKTLLFNHKKVFVQWEKLN